MRRIDFQISTTGCIALVILAILLINLVGCLVSAFIFKAVLRG